MKYALSLLLAAAPQVAGSLPAGAVPLGARPLEASDADSVTRVYDLSLAAPSVAGGSVWEVLLPITRDVDEDDNGLENEEGDAGQVANLVLQVFEDEFQYEGRSIDLYDDEHLVVTGPAAVHQRVRALLSFLEDCERDAIELRLDVIDLGRVADVPADLVISPAEAHRLRDTGLVSSRVLRVRPGAWTQSDALSEIQVLRTWRPEIAQGSSTFHPRIDLMACGTRLALQAALAGDGVRLALLQRRGVPGARTKFEVRAQTHFTTEAGLQERTHTLPFESVPVSNRSLALQTFLRPGEVLALRSGWDLVGGRGGELVLLELAGPLPAVRREHDAGTGRVLEVGNATWAAPRWNGDLEVPRRLTRTARSSPREFGEVSEALRLGVGLDSFEPETHIFESLSGFEVLWFEGARYFALRDADAARTPESVFQALGAQTERFELDVALMRGEPGEPREIARLALPLVAGEDGFAALGFESTALARFDTEVAQFAATATFEVEHVFDGLVLCVRPERRLDGGWSLELGVRAHVLDGPLQTVATGVPFAETLQRFTHKDLFLEERVELSGAERGARIQLGDHAQNEPGALFLELRVR